MNKFRSDLAVYLQTFRKSHADPTSVATAASLERLAQAFDTRIATIDADRLLSPLGQHQARAAALNELQARVQAVYGELRDRLGAQASGERTRLEAANAPRPRSETAQLLEHLQGAELRRLLYAAESDPIKLRSQLGDMPEIYREALEGAPAVPVRDDRGQVSFVNVIETPELSSPELHRVEGLRTALHGLSGSVLTLARDFARINTNVAVEAQA